MTTTPTRRGHIPPPSGEPQPQSGPLPSQPRALVPGLTDVNHRLFAPLQGLDPNNVLLGGYGWLSPTDGGMTLHPGLDLNAGAGCNADEGLLVVAPLAGIVRAVLYWDGVTPGEGNHVWLELDDPCLPGTTWLHYDHLLTVAVAVGQRVPPGGEVGTCGRSGGWDCAHLHTELLTGPPADGWWQWPYGWRKEQVEAAYWNPHQWWAAATALVQAEANRPIPPEAVAMLQDWQVLNWIMPDLWAWAGLPFNPEALTSKAWLEELRRGRYRGRPRTADRAYGEGDQRGHWAEFDGGVVVTNTQSGEWSWQG